MQNRRAMDEQAQDPDLEEKPAEVVVEEGSMRFERLKQLARRHPTLSVLGAAGVALFGGVEIAAAVLVGAGVAALVHAGEAQKPGSSVRERARNISHAMKERARTVVDSMRSKNATSEAGVRAPEARPET